MVKSVKSVLLSFMVKSLQTRVSYSLLMKSQTENAFQIIDEQVLSGCIIPKECQSDTFSIFFAGITLSEGWYILGDLNINLYHNGSILREENKNIIKFTNKVSSETRKYLEFCKTFGLKQIIKSPNRVTANTSTLIDHILTNTNEKITQCGLINIELSDHQIIFGTRKIKKKK